MLLAQLIELRIFGASFLGALDTPAVASTMLRRVSRELLAIRSVARMYNHQISASTRRIPVISMHS